MPALSLAILYVTTRGCDDAFTSMTSASHCHQIPTTAVQKDTDCSSEGAIMESSDHFLAMNPASLINFTSRHAEGNQPLQ